jgi:hypothetical protein
MAELSDGRILLAGSAFMKQVGSFDPALACFSSAGMLDLAFGNEGKATFTLNTHQNTNASNLVVLPDGKIVAMTV